MMIFGTNTIHNREGFAVKKSLNAFVLAASLLALSLPFSVKAPAMASDADAVIDMHGTKTYLGTSSAWAATWSSDNFEDVTNQDVSYGGNLTIKSGTVKAVEATGTLTVQDGTMTSVSGGSDVAVDGGTIKGTVASENGSVTLDGTFTVNGSVTADTAVTFSSGKIAVGGAVTAPTVTFNSGVAAKIGATVTGSETISVGDCTLSTQAISGADTGTLKLASYGNKLPTLQKLKGISISGEDHVILNQSLSLDTLTLPSGTELAAYSQLTVNTLTGPGTLCVTPGNLTINGEVTGTPVLVFNHDPGNGGIAFRAGGDYISSTDLCVYGYSLESYTSGSSTVYKTILSGSSGLSFDHTSAALGGSASATITAGISPALTKYADGTAVVWELHGDNTSYSLSASGMTATVTQKDATRLNPKAVVVAYLVDKNGTPLSGYRAAFCSVTGNSDYQLDTSTVSVLTGDKYGILALGGSGAKPSASSSNASVASLSDGKQVTDSTGDAAWFYTVTGGSAGAATLTIGGQTVAVTVNDGIMIDTYSYTMGKNAQYCIGITAKGVAAKDLHIYSTSSCTDVSFYRTGSDGKLLYRITGKSDGTADVVYQVGNGQSIRTHVTVRSGASSYGSSARLVALRG